MLKFTAVGVHANGFADPLLEGLDFTLSPGEALTLIGPPGCGKSTALALVAGGLKPTAGAVELDGVDLASLGGDALALHRRKIGFTPQRGGLLSNLTLVDNISLPLRYHRGADEVEVAATLKRLFRLFEVDDPPAVQASYASATWRWIAALARALVLEPDLLVVDDLGEELEVTDREDLWRLLWRVHSERGFAVLATTSDAGSASTLGDRVLALPGRRQVNFRILRASAMTLNPYTPSAP